MQAALKSLDVRHVNQLQLALSYLEMELDCPLARHCPLDSGTRRAINALRQAIIIHNQRDAMLRAWTMIVPPSGGIIVVPHGSQIVSHDDLLIDIPADEVRVVEASDVKKG